MALQLLSKKNKEVNKVVLIPLKEIVRNPNQPRKDFDPDDLQELSRSIIANGLLQPITVRKRGEGEYELIAGERRTLAFRALGRDHIPAIVEDYTDEQSAILALIENLQRKDLNYFEEAQGIAKLMEMLNLTQQQISVQLGKAQSTVANKLRLLRYPFQMQEKMLNAGLTERHARALLKLDDQEKLAEAVDFVIEKKLNVEQTEQLVESLVGGEEEEKKERTRLFVVKDMRIFINTLKKAVSMMNLAGINVATTKNESKHFVEYVIKIPKEAVYKKELPKEDGEEEDKVTQHQLDVV